MPLLLPGFASISRYLGSPYYLQCTPPELQNFLDVPDDIGDIRMQCAQSKKRSVLPGVCVLRLDMSGVVCAAGTAEIGEVVVWATRAEFLL